MPTAPDTAVNVTPKVPPFHELSVAPWHSIWQGLREELAKVFPYDVAQCKNGARDRSQPQGLHGSGEKALAFLNPSGWDLRFNEDQFTSISERHVGDDNRGREGTAAAAIC